MVTTPNLIAAESQRRRIPEYWQVIFTEMTNAELASMANDPKLEPVSVKDRNGNPVMRSAKAYALWELEYREAANIDVYYDDGDPATATRPDGKRHTEADSQLRIAGIKRRRLS